MKLKFAALFFLMSLFLISCGDDDKKEKNAEKTPNTEGNMENDSFDYVVDEFADLKILRYRIPGWENLSLQEKELVYYLTQAGLSGRDIFWDQNYRYNLKIRKALENIYTTYSGDKSSEDWKNFETYLKRVWFSNGIHHHYSHDKIQPKFSQEYFDELLSQTNTDLTGEAYEVIFNEEDMKKVNLDASKGLLAGSATNFYGENVSAEEVHDFYANKKSPNPEKPLAFGLNSKLVEKDGKLQEKVWKSGGMYGPAIDEIIKWLEKAKTVAENEQQAKALELLIEYYKTGSLKIWDDYNIAWVNTTEGDIDYINGFIEVYNDPLGFRGSYETIVQIKDFEMSKKMGVLEDHVQWFEDNSPIMDAHKKDSVVGVTYKTVIVAGEAGAASPSTPIGVNLPNSNWIREKVGSKSVSLGNIINAYDHASSSGRLEEFAYDSTEIALSKQYGELADKLHTALHEVVGHASGKINPGVGETRETLKSYASTLEEGRADLVGLYYLMDPKLQELGLVDDYRKVGMAAYNDYIRNGLLTQLVRIEPGNDIEEAHMRNRAWISRWVFEKGKDENLPNGQADVIEKITKNGKTYYHITDYARLRELFGELLRETQRIKSEGDYEAAKALVENYGVKIDRDLHEEVLKRNEAFKSAPYSGFVNPILVPETNNEGKIIDIKVEQPKSFEEQMLNYSKNFGFLPAE
ncbi:MAG TPA: dihydrofolate reductase [Flavobacteriaceae bacterium]|nr:dihydrofolate reductase [Flavobacteriaceae bacterium]